MMYPMFSALSRVSKAIPITLSSCRAGPPLFPLFIAASICKRKGTALRNNSCQLLLGNFEKGQIFFDNLAIILEAPIGKFTTVSQRSHNVFQGSDQLHIVIVTICLYGYLALSWEIKRHSSSVVNLVKLTWTNQIFGN